MSGGIDGLLPIDPDDLSKGFMTKRGEKVPADAVLNSDKPRTNNGFWSNLKKGKVEF